MALKNFTIELRVNFDDDEKAEAIRMAVIEAARQLYTTASFVPSRRPPMIAVFHDDMFYGKDEIVLTEEDA